MKIAILEKTEFSQKQLERLNAIAEVDFYDNLTQEQANEIAPRYDVVVLNWLDPTPFLLDMKPGSLVALLSTGYGWITNIKEANEKRIYVANIPGYSTEAVAEHLLGLLLGVSKNILPTANKADNGVVGFELMGKMVGIIGLGNIGSRFAEIMKFFGATVVTYNRNKKNSAHAYDVELNELLSVSDIICISCSLNSESKNMINADNIHLLKDKSVVIGSTWGVIDEVALANAVLTNKISYVSFDAALEGDSKLNLMKGLDNKVYLTPHIAYNTQESQERQLDICVSNIENFLNGNPKNIVF